MPANTANTETAVASLHYPRTGKRGVPQQFPRRLYEMLQSESKLIEASADHPKIIFWSESGKAFRIADVAEFSATILPKYFRTKKFSSFQRNLNLYGFAKVRRGPETDMYAHPSFVRDQPESLSELRKLTSTSSRRRAREVPSILKESNAKAAARRSVSPSPTLMLATAQAQYGMVPRMIESHVVHKLTPSYTSPKHTSVWAPIHKVHEVPLSPDATTGAKASFETPSQLPKKEEVGRGRLDLLALAMEQATAMQR